jgi:hypothetical protein
MRLFLLSLWASLSMAQLYPLQPGQKPVNWVNVAVDPTIGADCKSQEARINYLSGAAFVCKTTDTNGATGTWVQIQGASTSSLVRAGIGVGGLASANTLQGPANIIVATDGSGNGTSATAALIADILGTVPVQTATALAATPTPCTSGQFAQGVDASGNSIGCGAGGTVPSQPNNTITGNNSGSTSTPGPLTPAQTAALLGNNIVYSQLGGTNPSPLTPTVNGVLAGTSGNQNLSQATNSQIGSYASANSNTQIAANASGSDHGAKITSAIAALPSAGGIVDAQGLTGAQSWSTCPTWGSSPVILLTGVGTITSNASSCTIPSNVTWIPNTGSLLTVASGNTLIINKPPGVPPWQQVFPSAPAGTLTIGFSPMYPEYFGAKADGSTDSTVSINSAISLSAGGKVEFTCAYGKNYLVSGQIVFIGTRDYWGGTVGSGNNCAIYSSFSGTDAAFLFAGADHFSVHNLVLNTTSSTAPYTVATFGTTAVGTHNGNHVLLDHVKISGFAQKAIVYSISSEEWTNVDSYFQSNGGGALYVYYTSSSDDLSACSECISGQSNTDIRHYGVHWIDTGGTTLGHITAVITGTVTGDVSIIGGYMVGENNGSAVFGYAVGVGAVNAGHITIDAVRCEDGIGFWTALGSTPILNLTMSNNGLTNGSLTGGLYFGNANGLALNNYTEFGNTISPTTLTDNYSGLSNPNIFASYGGTFTSATGGGFVTLANTSWTSSNLILIPNSAGKPTCNAAARGMIYDLQTGTPDIPQICERTGSGTFAWQLLGGITNAAVTFTPGTGVTSATCSGSTTCDGNSGSVSIAGGSGTTGTIATINWNTTYTTAPRWCSVAQNGGAALFNIGHGVPTTTGMTITAGLTVSGATVAVDYECRP